MVKRKELAKQARRLAADPKAGSVAAGAVAAAAAGAAAAAKMGRDRALRRRRAFRLDPHEGPAQGIRRIARGQINLSLERLEHAGRGELGDAVHDVRKRLKRLRAVVRLVRDELGDQRYRRENVTFRDLGRGLADVRDATVLVETLDGIAARYADRLEDGAFGELRAVLVTESDAARASVANDGAAVGTLSAELRAARDRLQGWPLSSQDGYAVLAPGFERIYRRARRALRAARKDATEESLHELRKRTKDVWHAAQVVRPVAPKPMGRLVKRAHRLSDAIGAEHDLAVLLEAAAARREHLAPGELELLGDLVAQRRKQLRRRALKRARRVYARKPKKLVRAFAHAG